MNENQHRNASDRGSSLSMNLFIEENLRKEYPTRFVMHTISSNNGTTDLRWILVKQEWNMDSARAIGVVRRRCFLVFLKCVATIWFTRLSLRSITSFN